MAVVSRSVIISWLKCPELLVKLTNWLDSFWHKDDKIPLSALEGTIETIEVIDNLTSTRTDAALSANQGRILNEKIEEIKEYGNGENMLTVFNDIVNN